jgi:hypothetical protein
MPFHHDVCGGVVTDSGFDPEAARAAVRVVQADLRRLPVRLESPNSNHSDLWRQLASDVDVLAEVLNQLVEAVEADRRADDGAQRTRKSHRKGRQVNAGGDVTDRRGAPPG